MAFPYIFESNFEAGTNAEWDTETDTGSLLDFPHVSELARYPWSNCAPYRGAFCMRVRMGDTNDHTLTEGDIDIGAGVTRYFRFYFYIGPDIHHTTADDVFNIFELQQAGGTIEGAIGIRYTAATDLIEIGVGELTATAFSANALETDRWYCVELTAVVDSGVGNDGTLTLFVDGQSVASVATLDQGAVGQGVLGTQLTLSTTSGTLLFDQFVMDDTRVYPLADRFPHHVLLTKSGHVCLGNGVIDNVSLLSGAGTDNVLTLYDTAIANTSDAYKIGLELKNIAASDIVDPAGMPVQFKRGVYVALSGTNPRALVNVCHASGYGSSAVLRNYGQRHKSNPYEV